MSDEVVVVVASGPASAAGAVLAVPAGATVIAADGGLGHAWRLGLDVSLLVGDLDSATPSEVAKAESEGIPIERHPREKDATDLELALDAAAERRPGRIVVLGSDGGRLDHLLGSLLVLGSQKYAAVEIDALIGRARVQVVRGERALAGRPGELVSLFALDRPAEEVHTEGLLYALDGESLEPGSSRGVSNVFVSDTARISVARGVVLAIRPGAEEP